MEGEISEPQEMQAGVPQGSDLPLTLHNVFVNAAFQTPGVQLVHFADDTCLYANDHKQGVVLRKV